MGPPKRSAGRPLATTIRLATDSASTLAGLLTEQLGKTLNQAWPINRFFITGPRGMQLRPNLLELPLGQAGLGLGVGEEFFRNALGQGGRVNGRSGNSAGTSRATTTSTARTTAATAHETRGDFRRVTVQLLRLGQFDFQLCNAILVFRLGSKIVQFMRIVFSSHTARRDPPWDGKTVSTDRRGWRDGRPCTR